MKIPLLAGVFCLIIPVIFAQAPLPPEDAVATFQTHPDLEVELVASEPLVMDPVAFDWDEKGRLWVVEMRDYPNGLTWNKPDDPRDAPGGRVKLLTDTDGDGKYDEATLFLDDLPYPTGIKVWQDGVLASAAPDIIFAKDTDGDGAADETKIWYSGFAQSNQQHRVNGFGWGLDNCLHIANGDGGGVIHSRLTREDVDIRGHDLKIDPVTHQHSLLSGRTQCGRFRDDWGNWFGCNNSNPLWHFPLRHEYMVRNPMVRSPRPNLDVPEIPGAAPIFPASETAERFNQQNMANRITSACGPAIYRDTFLGDEYYGNAFICEPVHNMIHRQVLTETGATFSSRRAQGETEREFVASTDQWCRPVSVKTGPDGAIWFADMYRYVIEHPEWIPHEQQAKLEIRAGADKGRIYRIRKRGIEHPAPALGDPIMELESTNGTRRDLAHQILAFSDTDDEKIEALMNIVFNSSSASARLHAYSILYHLGVLDESLYRKAFFDPHPGVVRNAIRLSGKEAGLEILGSVDLNNPSIAQEAAGQLGFVEGGGKKLASILEKHHSDAYVNATALSSVNRENLYPILRELDLSKLNTDTVESLARMVAAWKGDALSYLRETVESGVEDWQLAVRLGLNEKLRKLDIADIFEEAEVTEWRRIAAIRVLHIDDKTSNNLFTFLSPTVRPNVRAAALNSLLKSDSAAIRAKLFDSWSVLDPQVRSRVVTELLNRKNTIIELVAALEENVIPVSSISASARQRLLESSVDSVTERCTKIFGSSIGVSRESVVAAYADVLDLDGAADAGRSVFQTACVSCHVAEGQGNPVGPDLAALTDRTGKSLLTAILDPNRAIEDKYAVYVIETNDDTQLFGMIDSENATGLSLRLADGSAKTVLRSEIKSIQTPGISLMPAGLETTLSKTDLADVIAYVQSLGGNKPVRDTLSARIRPRQSGDIELSAAKCVLAGPSVTINPANNLIDSWTSSQDRAEWTLVLDRSQKYRVEVNYSENSQSDGRWIMLANGETVMTGSASSSPPNAVDLSLPGGDIKIVVKPVGSFTGGFFALKNIRFIPVNH